MAKKRYISSETNFSTVMNSLSDFAERTFFRLLAITDDFGVIPADHETLCYRIGYKGDKEERFGAVIEELLSKNLLLYITYGDKKFLMFKPHTFDELQTNVANRTRSEFIGIRCKNRAEFDHQVKLNNLFIHTNTANIIISEQGIGRREEGEGRREKGEQEFILEKPRLDENDYLEIRDSWAETYMGNRIPPYDATQLKEWWMKFGSAKLRDAVDRVKKRSGWKIRMILEVLEGRVKPEEFLPVGKIKPEVKTSNLPAYKPYSDKTKDVTGESMPDEVRVALRGLKSKSIDAPSEVDLDAAKRKAQQQAETLMREVA